jgi:hypothetical protein
VIIPFSDSGREILHLILGNVMCRWEEWNCHHHLSPRRKANEEGQKQGTQKEMHLEP